MKLIDVEQKDGTVSTEVIYNVHDYPYSKYAFAETCRGKHKTYLNISAAFDIETTSIDCDTPYGYMYIWQFCLKDTVVMGRTWEEFILFINELRNHLDLHGARTLVIYVHYLTFEFQFFRNFIEINSVFATDKNSIVKVSVPGIEFRCSYRLSNMSLLKFCQNSKLCTYYKMSGEEFDYSVVRTAKTVLSNDQLAYCYCDVRGLCQCIDTLLLDDTIVTLPITSTGYVRRDYRKSMLSNPDNRERFTATALSTDQYVMLKQARRGGNTHANPLYANEILYNVHGRDRASAYPYEMLTGYYPVTKFVKIGAIDKHFDDYIHTKCVLMEIVITDLLLIKTDTVAYIAKAKCTNIVNGRYDNGRLVQADLCKMIITEIDYHIIVSQYAYNNAEVLRMYVSDRGMLSKEFRQVTMQYYYDKTTLKGKDPYMYARSKNKLNAGFGMMLTDIVHEEYTYNKDSADVFDVVIPDIDKALDKHYASRSAFLSYQNGVWVTAHARYNLQLSLNETAEDTIYCDTDSNKFIGDHDDWFNKANQDIIDKADTYDVIPMVEYNGKKHYLGVWDNDGEYDRFKTLGAKKYAYEEDGNFVITVAGLSKDKGAKYIQSVDNFNTGIEIPSRISGRTTAYYNNEISTKYITVDGCKMLTGSNVAVINTTYTLGITDEYYDYTNSVKKS